MASGIVDGKPTILIPVRPFKKMLAIDGRMRPPFTQRQKNNFVLALVHEAVHLQGEYIRKPGNTAERLREELRAWWEVSRNVVRPLRSFHQPMKAIFLAVDEAFRACGDQQQCPLLKPLIFAKPLK